MSHFQLKSPFSLIGAGLLVLTLMPGIASGAGYLKIGDIKGESTKAADSGHKDWIVIESLSFGTERPPMPRSSARRLASLSEVSIAKQMDSATPQMQRACAQGTNFPTATIRMEREGGNRDRARYIQYELTNVKVTCTSSDGQPTEDFSLNFAEIKVEYTESDAPEASSATVSPATAAPATLRPQNSVPRAAPGTSTRDRQGNN